MSATPSRRVTPSVHPAISRCMPTSGEGYAQSDKNNGRSPRGRVFVPDGHRLRTLLRSEPLLSGHGEEAHAGQREDVTEEERCRRPPWEAGRDGTDSARGGAARVTSGRWHMTMQLVVAPLYQEARAGRVRIEDYLPEPDLHFIHLLRLARRSANADHSFPPNQRAEELGSLTQLFFNDTAPTEIYTLSLHDALPI